MIHPNTFKYLKAPTVEQIEAAVKAAGVSQAQFERYYHLHKDAIRFCLKGLRTMPSKYWHIFYEAPVNLRTPMRTKATSKAANKRTKVKTTGSLSKIV